MTEEREPRLDAAMINDLREWRRRIAATVRAKGPSVTILIDELDAMLAAIDERDALKREATADPVTRSKAAGPASWREWSTEDQAIVETAIDAAVEDDERIGAWNAISAHPFFRDCYGTRGSLLAAMLGKLTASTFTAEIPDEIRERAAASPTLGIPRERLAANDGTGHVPNGRAHDHAAVPCEMPHLMYNTPHCGVEGCGDKLA